MRVCIVMSFNLVREVCQCHLKLSTVWMKACEESHFIIRRHASAGGEIDTREMRRISLSSISVLSYTALHLFVGFTD